MSLNIHSKVLPIAHRGASAYAPENTLSAIRKAQELDSHFIEIDVHMTADGEVVAIHDPTINRTSNSEGKVIDYELAELKKMDFGKWFKESFKDEQIPTLSEVLKILRPEDFLIIELKYGSAEYKNIEEKIVKLINDLGLQKQVILKSFNRKILDRFEELAPTIERLFCTFGGISWITLDNFLHFKGILADVNFQYLQVHKYFLNQSLIDDAHKKGIKVIVWDVHDKASMEKYIRMNVDFIESDNPDYVLAIQNK